MKQKTETQIARIAQHEAQLDRCRAALDALGGMPALLAQLHADTAALAAYYTSADWRADFAADEAGRLPADLKRGVLSEDGIDHLLDDWNALKAELQTILLPEAKNL